MLVSRSHPAIRRPSPSTLLTDRPHGRINATVILLTSVSAALAWFAVLAVASSLPTIQPALPVFYAVATLAAVVAAYLLHIGSSSADEERLRWLAWAYGVAGLAMALQILGFPGFFPRGGPLQTTSSGAAALYLLWHLAVPSFALAALVIRAPSARRWRIGFGLGMVGLVMYAAWGGSLLPNFIGPDGRYSMLLTVTLAVLAACSAVVTVLWARAVGRRPSWAEAWLTVGLAFGAWDVLLHAFAEERFTVPWWASLTMRLAQFLVPAAGLLAGFVGLHRDLSRYADGIAARLDEEIERGHREILSAPESHIRSEATARLQRVLSGDGLTVIFQPIVELTTGAVVGAEALARFTAEPVRPPNEWFAEAWAVGLGVELELAAARAALAQLPSLPAPAYLALNLSPLTINSGRFLDLLGDVSGDRLIIEVTEHAAVYDYESLADAIQDLRSHGVRLAIDDVGNGFSSLRHVTRLDPDMIKLDISLTRGVADDPVSQTLAAALSSFARDTGIAVVAEGVETAKEAAALLELGVGFGQGYHFARPAPLPLPTVAAPRPVRVDPVAGSDRHSGSTIRHSGVMRQDSAGLLQPIAVDDHRATKESAPGSDHFISAGIGGLLVTLVIVVLWYIVGLPGGFSGVVIADAIFTGTMGLAAIVCFWAAWRLGSVGRPWWWIGAGHAAWFAGTLVWNYHQLWQRVSVPYPSLADVGFLAYYPLTFIGILGILRSRTGGPSGVDTVLDVLIVGVSVSGLLFELLLAPLNTASGSGIELVVSLLWQGGTLGLVYLGVSTFIWHPSLLAWRSAQILLAAVALVSVGNVLYARDALAGTYAVGDRIDLTWHASALFVAVAALFAVRKPLPLQSVEVPHERFSGVVPRTLLSIVSVFAIAAWGAIAALQSQPDWSAAVVIVTVGSLATLRMARAASLDSRLIQRTRERDRLESVVQAAATIAGTLDQDLVLRNLAAAATRAVHRTKAEIYVYVNDEPVDIVASAVYGVLPVERAILARHAALPLAAKPAVARLLASGLPTIQSTDDTGMPREVAETLRSIGKQHALLAPLVSRGKVLGHIAIWTPVDRTPFFAEDIAAAAAIGQEAGVAIDNARLIAALRQQADADGLTGLLNHRAILGALDLELDCAAEGGSGLAVLLIDLDDFKRINDDHGHLAGDRVLRAAATVLQECVRGGDHVGRYGGDEFLVVLVGADAAEAGMVADRILGQVAATDNLGVDGALRFNVSIGVSVFPRDGATKQELLVVADAAMYVAKATSRYTVGMV